MDGDRGLSSPWITATRVAFAVALVLILGWLIFHVITWQPAYTT